MKRFIPTDLIHVSYLLDRLREGPSLFPDEDRRLSQEVEENLKALMVEISILRARSKFLARLLNSANLWLKAKDSIQYRDSARSLRLSVDEWNKYLVSERQDIGVYCENEREIKGRFHAEL